MKKKNHTLSSIKEIAESLGFTYRASGVTNNKIEWITLTYPNTNSCVIHITIDCDTDIMLELGNQLVRCGRIQQRQALIQELSPFNYS